MRIQDKIAAALTRRFATPCAPAVVGVDPGGRGAAVTFSSPRAGELHVRIVALTDIRDYAKAAAAAASTGAVILEHITAGGPRPKHALARTAWWGGVFVGAYNFARTYTDRDAVPLRFVSPHEWQRGLGLMDRAKQHARAHGREKAGDADRREVRRALLEEVFDAARAAGYDITIFGAPRRLQRVPAYAVDAALIALWGVLTE